MKHRATSIILATALGLGGVTAGMVVAPALAAAATGESAGAAVSGRVTRITDALAGLVSDGSISQAQADEVATTLAESLPRGGGHGGGHGGGRGGGRGPGGPGFGRGLEAAAGVLDVTVEELRAALRDGRSLADVAKAEDISTDTLIAGLVEAAEVHLAEHVADGRLTQAEADARTAELTERITAGVEREGLPGRGGRGGAPKAGESESEE